MPRHTDSRPQSSLFAPCPSLLLCLGMCPAALYFPFRLFKTAPFGSFYRALPLGGARDPHSGIGFPFLDTNNGNLKVGALVCVCVCVAGSSALYAPLGSKERLGAGVVAWRAFPSEVTSPWDYKSPAGRFRRFFPQALLDMAVVVKTRYPFWEPW